MRQLKFQAGLGTICACIGFVILRAQFRKDQPVAHSTGTKRAPGKKLLYVFVGLLFIAVGIWLVIGAFRQLM